MVGDDGQVGAGIRNEQVFSPSTIDSVAEAPAAEPATALRVNAI
jgi:hypothetical protein